jgi:hypothetical protein
MTDLETIEFTALASGTDYEFPGLSRLRKSDFGSVGTRFRPRFRGVS